MIVITEHYRGYFRKLQNHIKRAQLERSHEIRTRKTWHYVNQWLLDTWKISPGNSFGFLFETRNRTDGSDMILGWWWWTDCTMSLDVTVHLLVSHGTLTTDDGWLSLVRSESVTRNFNLRAGRPLVLYRLQAVNRDECFDFGYAKGRGCHFQFRWQVNRWSLGGPRDHDLIEV